MFLKNGHALPTRLPPTLSIYIFALLSLSIYFVFRTRTPSVTPRRPSSALIRNLASASASGADIPPAPARSVFVYEKNQKTGSTSWEAMLRDAVSADGRITLSDCKSLNVLNGLYVKTFAEQQEGDVLIPCHVRRTSIPRSVDVKIISSFNLEKDMLVSAYLQFRNLKIHDFDAKSAKFLDFKKRFRIFWSLIYMGYGEGEDDFIRLAKCPLTSQLNDLVQMAVDDSFLPITHDLPCISKKLLVDKIGIKVKETLTLNVRNGEKKQQWLDLSCADMELSKRMTQKMLNMYDGTDMEMDGEWISFARAKEADCVAGQKG